MKKIIETVEKLCNEKGYSYLLLENPQEIWISGYKNDKKFDVFIRKFPEGYIKLVYEIPEERKPMLFKDSEEEPIIERLLSLLEEEEMLEKEETQEHIFTQITGLMSDDKLVEMYLKSKEEKQENKEEIS